ncbi:hypothetical protein CUMW_118870, partial [Citrus unshiu]
LLNTYFDRLFRNINLKQFDALFEELDFEAMDDIDALKTVLFYFADRVLNGRKAWIYEAIGGVPSAWVVKTKKKIPRIVQWKLMTFSKINFAEVYLFLNDESRLGDVLQTIEPNAKESRKKYWLTVKDYMPCIPGWFISTNLQLTPPPVTRQSDEHDDIPSPTPEQCHNTSEDEVPIDNHQE